MFALATPALAATNASDTTRADVTATQDITVIAHALPLAPSSTPLDVTQPTSVIQSGFIANNIAPLASIDDIIKFQPSVWSENPNGPGIGKAETMAIRGFQDGQYNVTFDGIPFGDSQDLHHTTSSLFIAHALQQAQIDRGPGSASTIGKATFGGTVGFLSKDPLEHFDIDTYGTVGSYDTLSGGGRVDTGNIGGFRMYVEGQHEKTDGYLTGSNEHRDNLIGKAIYEISPTTKLTAMASWNREYQNTTQGATLQQYAQYGDNYGLCDNKAAMCYYGYQPSRYSTDFEYLRLQTSVGPVQIDNQVYHNGFTHKYTESSDASDDNIADNGVTFYSPTTIGKKVATYSSDIKGKYTNAVVSSWGDTLRFQASTAWADIKWGVWFDSQHDSRYSETVDITQSSTPVTGKTGTAYSYNYADLGTTWQPYLEVDFHPVSGLTINPGIKYTNYKRDLHATLNKKGPNGYTSIDYDAWQPSIAANYRITNGWSAYAQVARGFLAPPIAVFQVDDPTELKPELTWNYQIGTVVHGRRWSLSADAYYIDFSNSLSAQTTIVDGTSESSYVNAGGAIYKGLEFEGQYVLAKGLSLYGNATLNSAKYKDTGARLEEAPKWTAATGIIYEDKHGPFGSLIGKWVGPRYGNDNGNVAMGAGYLDGNVAVAAGTIDDPTSRIGTTFSADLAFGWHFEHVAGLLHQLTASVKIGNLFNSHAVTDYAGTQSAVQSGQQAAYNLYWRQPGRSVFFNIETHF
ncbi:TonB-dependent receptor [Sphingomonas abietis]|uniref:TonB-dependent receptor n=1 Tax=Sphingomonas abietis TaxID=3012344 RepID=A0ABY7NGM2_9SPHN|nr:TonB-dependent receptor [Sphingomonas abietis]WBO20697.1 TonB-dependent receptor [Sphingomonas abietis]